MRALNERLAAASRAYTQLASEAELIKRIGAALKVGQMLSFNDADVLPPAVRQAMERVRDGAFMSLLFLTVLVLALVVVVVVMCARGRKRRIRKE